MKFDQAENLSAEALDMTVDPDHQAEVMSATLLSCEITAPPPSPTQSTLWRGVSVHSPQENEWVLMCHLLGSGASAYVFWSFSAQKFVC